MLLKLEHATLALFLSRIEPPSSPRKVLGQHLVIATVVGQCSVSRYDLSTSRAFCVTTSCTDSSRVSRRRGCCAGGGCVDAGVAVWNQRCSRLHSSGKEGEHDSRVPRNKYTPTADDVTSAIIQLDDNADRNVNQVQHTQGQTRISPEVRLKGVVAQLQGDIQADNTPEMSSRVRLDGIFAELRATKSTETLPTASISAISKSVEFPSPRPAHADIVSDGELPSPNAISPGNQDLESLSSMLERLQATAKARDLTGASERAAALRSGVYLEGRVVPTPMKTFKHDELKTRFANIRKGRVSWAVLPLIVRARQAGIPLSTGVYNAAIAAYISTPRKYADAIKVLQLLKDSGDPLVRPDLKSYNIAMRVCGEAGKWREVLELLEEMQAAGISSNTASYNCALNGLAKDRQWNRARSVFRKMVDSGLSPDDHSYNGLVEAAGMGSTSPRQSMIQIVYDMEQAGVEPTQYTYTLLLDCLVQRGETFDGFQAIKLCLLGPAGFSNSLEERMTALQVMARLVDARAPLLPSGYRAGLSLCKEYGDWRRAMVLMEDMRVAKMRISGTMYLLAIHASAKGGKWERALSLMVEWRKLTANEAVSRQTELKRAEGRTDAKAARGPAPSERRADELYMKIVEAVLSAVSEAGQFEVAIRLLQQIRSAGKTPSKACYLSTLRAASKWGHWALIESLMNDMRVLGVGVVPSEAKSGFSGEGTRSASRVLSSDCYAPLVEACAHAAAWEKAIKAYREGFGVGRGEVKAVSYRVYECVLKACVATSDGRTALEVIQRQAAELQQLELEQAASVSMRDRDESSGGPPDRRCWCLAAEALGRAGMTKEGHDILRAMVNSGMPIRESTKAEVPSLMPLPNTADGFDWYRRRRRRNRRTAGKRRVSGLHQVLRREVVIRRLIDASIDDSVSDASLGLGGGGKNNIAGVEISKGVVNGEACTAAAVAATGGKREGRKRSLKLGRLLVGDLKDKNSEIERDARSEGLLALECKRRRMQEFRRILAQRNEEAPRGEPTQRGLFGGTDTSFFITDADIISPMHKWPYQGSGKRGRNEALTLRVCVPRTPGVLGRRNGSRSRRRRKRYPKAT